MTQWCGGTRDGKARHNDRQEECKNRQARIDFQSVIGIHSVGSAYTDHANGGQDEEERIHRGEREEGEDE